MKIFSEILKKLKPTQIIVTGFIFLILIGTFLLLLPISSTEGSNVSITDALFTCTSAVCVTGLSVVNTLSHWTFFGKMVILLLIQIGGIGFMTIVTSVLIALGKKITLKERVLMKESFNLESFQGMVMFTKKIIKGTFICELIGAILLSTRFIPDYGFAEGIFNSLFHSVSAFCNAGFDIIGENSLAPYANDLMVNIVLSLLIITGGLGFIVWVDLLKLFKSIRTKGANIKNKIQMLSLHTKLVLSITLTLIVVGWIFFFLVEFNNPNTYGNMNFGEKLLTSFFQSVTLRTAGFATVNQSDLSYASKLMSIIFMAIGGSSGSTAGGIKTVTFGVILMSVISTVRGRDSICAYKKSISMATLQKALTVTVMMIILILFSTVILSISEQYMGHNYEFLDIFYEVTSAAATVGLSTGITPYLSLFGKLIICFVMFMGRLGPVTVAVAISSKQSKNENLIHYPEDKIFVG